MSGRKNISFYVGSYLRRKAINKEVKRQHKKSISAFLWSLMLRNGSPEFLEELKKIDTENGV